MLPEVHFACICILCKSMYMKKNDMYMKKKTIKIISYAFKFKSIHAMQLTGV